METLRNVLDMFLHVNDHLRTVIESHGAWTYALLFLIIFCETGLVVTPFLPGDSLLFAAGALAAVMPNSISLTMLLVLLTIAAILGDTVNYWFGRWIGPPAFSGRFWFLKQAHLKQTQEFYDRYGAATIILARFVPIVRTFAPFVAGVGRMNYQLFLLYNVVGGIAWVGICVLAGYFLGNIPWVKKNFELVVVAIVLVSVLPMVIEFLRHWFRKPALHTPPAGATPEQETPVSTSDMSGGGGDV